MKTKFNFLLLAGVCFITAVSAQTRKSEMLAGSWKVQHLTAEFPPNVTIKEKTDGEKSIAEDEAEFKKTGFLFSRNTLIVGKKKFTWVMNKDGKQVVVKKGNKVVITAKVLELSEHQLIFTRPDEGMIVTYTLYR